MLRVNGLHGHIARNNAQSLALVVLFIAIIEALWATAIFVVLFVTNLTVPLLGLILAYAAPKNMRMLDYWIPIYRATNIGLNHLNSLFFNTLHYPIVVAVVLLIIMIVWHRAIIDHITGAREISLRNEPRLYRLTETLAVTSGLPMPRLAVIENPALNAYATGLDPKSSTIAVTRGLLALNDRELSAVLAHEMTHIRNRDTRVLMAATVFGGLASKVCEALWRMFLRRKLPLEQLFRPDQNDQQNSGSRRQWQQALKLGCVTIIPFAGLWVAVPAYFWHGISHPKAAISAIVTALALSWFAFGHLLKTRSTALAAPKCNPPIEG